MNRFLFATILFSALFMTNCDDDCTCDSSPVFADLKIKVTINEENPEVTLIVLEGKIENQDTLFVETVNTEIVTFEMESNRYYSAVVAYTKGRQTIVAINGKKMESGNDDCDCPTPQDYTLNLRLLE